MTVENNRPRTAIVTALFAEGKKQLQLRLGELIALQEVLKSSPFALLKRLQGGYWMVEDIIHTVRLGLIGGGMSYQEAQDMVDRTIRAGYIMDHLPTALTVIFAALSGVEEDEDSAGEPQAPTTTETPTD